MKVSLINFNTFAAPLFSPDITVRYKKITKNLEQENADVICLQEISTYYHLLLIKRYLKQYPYLSYKKYLYGPKGGLVIASKVPMEKVDYKPFTTLGSFKNMSFYTRLLQNGMLCVRLQKQPLMFITTHLLYDFEFDWSPKNALYAYKQAEVEQVAKQVNEFVNSGYSVIITGDFNMKKHSKLYEDFLKQTKLRDTFAADNAPTYYNDRFVDRFKGKTSERIDYIFLKEVKQKIKILSQSHVFDKKETLTNGKKSYLSDHSGLKVDFDIV